MSPVAKDHIHMLKILSTLSELGGLWKHQNNPACTKSVRVIRMLNLGHYIRKGKKQRIRSVLLNMQSCDTIDIPYSYIFGYDTKM